MPVRRGHVAPQNTFIDTIIRKFDSQNRKFLISNAQVKHKPIIYCNDAFCDLTKYKRAEMMQKPCDCEFLYGKMTSNLSKTQINQALTRTEETQVVVLLYRKDGTNFLSNVLIAPVKNEKSQVILFILNFDELNETPDNRFTQGLKRNRLLQQIGMPFISTIFARSPTPPTRQIDSLGDLIISSSHIKQNQVLVEQMPLNQTYSSPNVEIDNMNERFEIVTENNNLSNNSYNDVSSEKSNHINNKLLKPPLDVTTSNLKKSASLSNIAGRKYNACLFLTCLI